MSATTEINQGVVEDAETFLRRYYDEDVKHLAELYPDEQRSLYVDWMDLFQFDPDMADDAIEQPDLLGEHLDAALRNYDLPVDVDFKDARVRLWSYDRTFLPGDQRSEHEGEAATFRGQVAKASEVRPKLTHAVFECQRCGTNTPVPQAENGDVQQPHECKGCERQGPFRINRAESEFVDHQFLEIQEPPEESTSTEPSSLKVHLVGDIVDQATAGDRVRVDGVLRINAEVDDSLIFEEFVDADAVRMEETDFEDVNVEEHRERITDIATGAEGDPYQAIVDSIAPGHHGDEDIKLALAMQLFGGVNASTPSGRRERGHSHMLLMGAPGVGKSTLLEYVNELAPRATMSSGKGMTASGLTAAAVRDEFGGADWTLNAGALVMADGGVACIDEIDKAEEDALDSLHQALEQQYIAVNKANINATLPTRTSLLASGNPEKGRFDPHEPFAEQIELGTALISRFDLIFLLHDQPDEEEDAAVAKHIIERREAAKGADASDAATPVISPDILRAYIALARQEVTPQLSDDVKDRCVDYYTEFRGANGHDEDSPVPVTPRNFEAALRLAEASARIRLSDTITEEDWTRAAQLIESSLRDVGIDPDTDQFDADIIETGASMSQKQRRELIIDTVAELQQDAEDGVVSFETIVAETVNDDSVPVESRDQIEHDVEKLRTEGAMYQPGHAAEDEYRVP